MAIGYVEKSNTPNRGVRCVVNSCHYYLTGDHCGAGQIEVRPKNAGTSEETDCATFLLEKEEDM